MTEWQRRIKRHVFLVAFRNTATENGVFLWRKTKKDKVASDGCWPPFTLCIQRTLHTMHASCHIHVTHMNVAHHTCVTFDLAYYTYERVIARVQVGHVTRMSEARAS